MFLLKLPDRSCCGAERFSEIHKIVLLEEDYFFSRFPDKWFTLNLDFVSNRVGSGSRNQ